MCVCLCNQHFSITFPWALLLLFWSIYLFSLDDFPCDSLQWKSSVCTWDDLSISFASGKCSFGGSWYSEQFPLKITMEILWLVAFYMSFHPIHCQCLSQIHSFLPYFSLNFAEMLCTVYFLHRIHHVTVQFDPIVLKITKSLKWISSQTLNHVYTWAVAPCKNLIEMCMDRMRQEREGRTTTKNNNSSQGKKRL